MNDGTSHDLVGVRDPASSVRPRVQINLPAPKRSSVRVPDARSSVHRANRSRARVGGDARFQPCRAFFGVFVSFSTLLGVPPGGFAAEPCVRRSVGPTTFPDELSSADWSSIRAAYEADRHAVHAAGCGYEARNPGQRWTTAFDCRGFTILPDLGDWSWGLDLAGYGFGEEAKSVTMPRSVTASGSRVEYDWSERLSEWWINDSRGLAHGYTVRDRPAVNGNLRLWLSVRGGLHPRQTDGGRSLKFQNHAGESIVNYSGLKVIDADGRELAAAFTIDNDRLYVTVDDTLARYPLTIDPIAQQQAYLKASNAEADDSFGNSVSVSGDTVIVGAYLEESKAIGVNGNQSDNSANGAGAAYVFVRNGATWVQQAYLKASNTTGPSDPFGDRFGLSVSVSGGTAVVGAYLEDSSAKGVNGNQNDNSAVSAGAAYVFVRSGSTWSQQAYLKASNTDPLDHFGESVSVSGDTVVVGASAEDSAATGVNGNQNDNSALVSGAAYVFVRTGVTWKQQAYLKASNAEAGDRFGEFVSISGETIVIGSVAEDSGAVGVNGNQGDNSASASGAAYVFVRSGSTWSQQAYLKASNAETSDTFGWSVSVSGDTIVIGAPAEDSGAVGVNGNQSDNGIQDSGAAYVFSRTGPTWSQQGYLKASNTGTTDSFGTAVAVAGDRVLVGASPEDSSATGINGDQVNNDGLDSGAAYVFVRSGSTWRQQAYVKASNSGNSDGFASSLSLSGDTVVVGATGEDSNATGVNGNQTDNSAALAGAAYLFALENCAYDLGFQGPGTIDLSICGDDLTVAGSAAVFLVTHAPANSTILLFGGLSNSPTPVPGTLGILVPVPILANFPLFLPTDATGAVTLPLSGGINSPITLYLQALAQNGAVVEFSNAIQLTLGF